MKISTANFTHLLKKHKRFNAISLINKSNEICVIKNDIGSESTKELQKFNHNDIHVNTQSSLYPVSLNTCCNNVTLKFSILIGLYNILILQLALVQSQSEQASPNASDGSAAQGASSPSTNTDVSFFDEPVTWMFNHFSCVLTGSSTCMQLTFLIIFLVGAVLSALGVMYKYLCKCCTCCCSKKKEQVDYHEQFEQLQHEQEELRKAIMDGQYFDKNKLDPREKKNKDDRDDKCDKHDKYSDKNNDPSNGMNEPRMRRSQSDSFHIGYQKPQQ
ncbi:hypothetical protein POVWA2_023760 [Plasmodium ovale wallikeri]|uniref:PIR Superfamily Protein n=1 Tax=Plasmodium ovale wallikeri TaxID=864142 RepID=A0A1A8YTC6_PLAOA|nr:hypothetical protein POVWA1_023870 [Plasmodium ovale wallikeri]SBT35198.1 hypothetical protein POVWA2_023760 [Plasmodium ovale wallikeri]